MNGWASDGIPTKRSSQLRKLDWLPWEPFEYWHSDGERLLDPMAGWAHTTQSSHGGSVSRRSQQPLVHGQNIQNKVFQVELWEQVWDEVAYQRSQWLGKLDADISRSTS